MLTGEQGRIWSLKSSGASAPSFNKYLTHVGSPLVIAPGAFVRRYQEPHWI